MEGRAVNSGRIGVWIGKNGGGLDGRERMDERDGRNASGEKSREWVDPGLGETEG